MSGTPPSSQPPPHGGEGSGLTSARAPRPPWWGAKRSEHTMPGAEDKFVQTLLDEGPDGYMLVESKMSRGSTHDKDRTTFTKLVDADNLTGELENMRTAQKLDMADRRAYDPENNPNEAGHK